MINLLFNCSVLRNEEGEEQLRLRRLQLPFNFATGEGMLYDVTPSVEIPEPCSAPKQRKVEDYSINPDSILGCMLRQDQSIYCEHNNTLSSLNDVAFKDSHATVSVPGDVWQHASPKPVSGLVKTEDLVQDVLETLQQILGDNSLVETLDVEAEELRSWESTLLRMSTSSCEVSDDLNSILSNDILSYVEEQLQKDDGLKLPSELDDIPACLTVDLQNHDPDRAAEQGFSWPPLEPQGQLIPNGLPTLKLTHMDLSGPTLQQIAPATFDPTLVDSCAQAQNKLRSLQVTAPMQNHVLRDQAADRKSNPVFNFQGNQWNGSAPNSNHVDGFVQSYPRNISKEPGFAADPPSSSCLQGHFALQTQSSDAQMGAWPHQQLISGGHQPVSTCLNQMPGFQSNLPPQPVANGQPMFRTPETPSVPFAVPQDTQPPAQAPSSSCMFMNSAPVNGVHLSQRMNPVGTNQISSKPSCLYQGLPVGGGGGGSVPGMTSIPNSSEVLLAYQMTAGLDQNGLHGQQFLNFSEQTQVKTTKVRVIAEYMQH